MFEFIKRFIARNNIPQSELTHSRQIQNKSLDETEVALQRIFWNKHLGVGVWQLNCGSTKDIKTQREVIYQFTPDGKDSSVLSLCFKMKNNSQGVLLSWAFNPITIDTSLSDAPNDQLIEETISKSVAMIDELVDEANDGASSRS